MISQLCIEQREKEQQEEREKQDGLSHIDPEHDLQHSRVLYNKMCQLYFHVIEKSSYIRFSSKAGMIQRKCHPVSGCNMEKPLNQFPVVRFDEHSVLLDASNFDRRCCSCHIYSAHRIADVRKYAKAKKLSELIGIAIKRLQHRLRSIVQDATGSDVDERVTASCLEQWKRQEGRCAHCTLPLAKGQRSITIDFDNTYVSSLFDVSIRYIPNHHQIEWIHECCNGFHVQQSLLFSNILSTQYKMVCNCSFVCNGSFDGDTKDEKKEENETPKETLSCLCMTFRVSLLNLVYRICGYAAPYINILKLEPIWIDTWKSFRDECGPSAFQDVATFLMELQQKKTAL
jgi:hypothetical protein